MKHSVTASKILAQIDGSTKLGDLRTMAKNIKKDHALALELWSGGAFLPRQLAILIMDHKELTPAVIDRLDRDMQTHPAKERTQLIDWLMANQLAKNSKTIRLMESWQDSPSPLQRRLFWYYQGRLRWMGQPSPDNTGELLSAIEANIAGEAREVQWAMNFTAGWIGVFDLRYRSRCIAIGEQTGLFKEEKVSKGCTPNYLPEFIAIESRKRNL